MRFQTVVVLLSHAFAGPPSFTGAGKRNAGGPVLSNGGPADTHSASEDSGIQHLILRGILRQGAVRRG